MMGGDLPSAVPPGRTVLKDVDGYMATPEMAHVPTVLQLLAR